ncbi:MAG: GMC family oxidoreductase [Myxococcales bacterium]|nr:GMC family oxidoreductase [Myxococcales bacterium]
MTSRRYDVVIVGAGVAGALVASHLTQAGLSVLLLEAGAGSAQALKGYDRHLQTYFEANGKGPEAPWPASANAPQPDTANLKFGNGYFVQNGPQLYGSSYTRLQGGSTLHWLGVSLRMLPEDFAMRGNFGVGLDWPIGYDTLEPYYRQAELDMGVSADVADQAYQGIAFADGYEYPMARVPLSYSDTWLGDRVNGHRVPIGDTTAAVQIRSYPAARNSTPRDGYSPFGAVDRRPDGRTRDPFLGGRCQGNTACIPICPVQAKYNANRTLARIDPGLLEIRPRAVASTVDVDENGVVQSVTYKRWGGGAVVEEKATARAFVLAAHAVENAKLLLNSGLQTDNGLVGRHLMDHPTLYAWGLTPEPVWPYRGPQSTAGVEDFRSGAWRARHAAFRFDVGNDGWRAPTGAPEANVSALLEAGAWGADLRRQLADQLARQVRFSLAVEQLPDPANRVTLSRDFLDPLGNPRPVIDYRIDEYTLKAMGEAERVAHAIFEKAGVQDFSQAPVDKWFPTVPYGDRVFSYHGMGHFAGTHIVGSDASNSVLDHTQRAWAHPNLYLVGSGSFPTMGTSNPTLTIAATAIRTAHLLAKELGA